MRCGQYVCDLAARRTRIVVGREQSRRIRENETVEIVVACRACGIEDVGRRVDRDVAGAEEAQLRREQSTRLRLESDDEDHVDVLATARFGELHRHTEAGREALVALPAACHVQQSGRRLREILQGRLITVPIEEFASGLLERKPEGVPDLIAALIARHERDGGLRAGRDRGRRDRARLVLGSQCELVEAAEEGACRWSRS